jgi:hypothetical protein
MLMCVDREHRLAYVLDVVFGLKSEEAGAVLDIGAAAYRKRLSRARAEQYLQDLLRMSDAAAVIRAHPEYSAPAAMIDTIRALLGAQG